MRFGEVRIERDSARKHIARAYPALKLQRGKRLSYERPAFEIDLIRLDGPRSDVHHLGKRCRVHGGFQRLGYLDRDLFLDGDDVVEGAVVSLRPKMKAVRRADELRRDAQPVAAAAHGAFKHMLLDAEPLRNHRHFLIGVLVFKG